MIVMKRLCICARVWCYVRAEEDVKPCKCSLRLASRTQALVPVRPRK